MARISGPTKTEADLPGVRQRAAWILHHPSYLTFLRKLQKETRAGLRPFAAAGHRTVKKSQSRVSFTLAIHCPR